MLDATISNGKTSYGAQSVYQNNDTQRIRKRGEVEPMNAQDRRLRGRQTRRYKRCKNWNIQSLGCEPNISFARHFRRRHEQVGIATTACSYASTGRDPSDKRV